MESAIRVASVVFPENRKDHTTWFIENRVSSKVQGSRSKHFRDFIDRIELGI